MPSQGRTRTDHHPAPAGIEADHEERLGARKLEPAPLADSEIGNPVMSSDHPAGEIDDRKQTLRRAIGLGVAVLTRGAQGTVLYTGDGKIEGTPVKYPARPDADNIGAGDACSAGLLIGMIRGWPLRRTLELANHMGAYVASVPGATPRLSANLLARVQQ